jgi:hypothetical protein
MGLDIREGSMVVEFRGPPPHDLGMAELATTRCVNEHIEITLHVVDDWHRPSPQVVRVQVASLTARSLLEQLPGVIAEAEAAE